MDAITRISYYFPTKSLTSFWIIANVITNNQPECQPSNQQLIIALLVIFAILNFFHALTDTYKASNNQNYWVFMIPLYGPTCFSLPSELDKDRVHEYFFIKIRDYCHGVVAMATFILILLFTNPIAACVFPNDANNGTSSLDPAVIRTVPIVVGIIMAFLMVCLGPPRQFLGFTNVKETAPSLERDLVNAGGQRSFLSDPGLEGGGGGPRGPYPADGDTSSYFEDQPYLSDHEPGSVSRRQDLEGPASARQLPIPSFRDSAAFPGGGGSSVALGGRGDVGRSMARDGGGGRSMGRDGGGGMGGRSMARDGGGGGTNRSMARDGGGGGPADYYDGRRDGGGGGANRPSVTGMSDRSDGANALRTTSRDAMLGGVGSMSGPYGGGGSGGQYGGGGPVRTSREQFGSTNVRAELRDEYAVPQQRGVGMVNPRREDYPSVRPAMTGGTGGGPTPNYGGGGTEFGSRRDAGQDDGGGRNNNGPSADGVGGGVRASRAAPDPMRGSRSQRDRPQYGNDY